MIITAALAWWNEPVAALDRLVRSLAGVADRIVAVDGRWTLMPGADLLSPRDQYVTLSEAAADVGIALNLHAPDPTAEIWSQVEKRDYLMRAASKGSDWVVVVDGDTWVGHCDGTGLRERLASATEDVALLEVTNVGEFVRSTWPRKRRLVYRAALDMAVVTAHNGYRAGDGRWLNGDSAFVDLASAVDVSDLLKLVHQIDSRGRERRGAQSDYYAARAGEGEEAWVAA